jgi:hypothetical protein
MDYSRILGDIAAATFLSVTGGFLRIIRRYKARLAACEEEIAKICRIPGVAEALEKIDRADRAHKKGWLDE